MTHKLEDHSSIQLHSLEALQEDALLPICTACGTQYPKPRDNCPICEDPRQAVNVDGQSWTSLAELGETRHNTLTQDKEDPRITLIGTVPAFAINQHPFLLETAGGSYIWDCSAFISPALIDHLSALKSPLRGIAISHPHFFTTSLTWSRALRVPIYLCEADKGWYQRPGDVRKDDQINWFRDQVELGPGVKVIQCGGHFPGSCILHWDRLQEPPPPKDNLPTHELPVSGIILTADTIMVQPTQKGFTFIWSVPNLIPLRPKDTLQVYERVKDLPFHQASSTWPNRFIRSDAKQVLYESIMNHLRACGWVWDGCNLVSM